MVRIAALVVLLSLSLAAPAAAVPGDPVPEPLAPATGATLPAGQPVSLTFSCPPYRQSPEQEAPGDDGFVGYGVQFATTPDFSSGIVGVTTARGSVAGQCTGTPLSSDGNGPLTEAGTYYWRVSRTCFCEGADDEFGPTASFTVAAVRAKLTASGPKRPYAGYAFFATLASDLPDGTEVALERGRDSSWTRVTTPAPTRTSDGKAQVPVTLGRARTSLRWVVTAGGQAGQTSAPFAVAPRKPGRASTSRRDDGRYVGAGKARTVFRVARGGRELRDFDASVPTFCIGGLDPTTNRLITSFAKVPRIRVAPDGRFLSVTRVSETDVVVSGRLQRGRVTGGRVSVSYPLCSGGRAFTARRR